MMRAEFAPCDAHRSLLTLDPFSRALEIAQECDECYVEEACS